MTRVPMGSRGSSSAIRAFTASATRTVLAPISFMTTKATAGEPSMR